MSGRVGLADVKGKTVFWFEVPMNEFDVSVPQVSTYRTETTRDTTRTSRRICVTGTPTVTVASLPQAAVASSSHLGSHVAPDASLQLQPSVVASGISTVSDVSDVNTGEVCSDNGNLLCFKGLRALIVDDEAVNRRLCLRMLNKDGDQVLPRLLRDAGGVSPYDSRQVFDVILMDIMMQRTNVRSPFHDSTCGRSLVPFQLDFVFVSIRAWMY
jgi:hypothetical protein